MYPPTSDIHSFPHYQHPHQNDTQVTTYGSALTHHNHLKSIVYIRDYSWFVHSMDLDKHIRTCAHHYSITQNLFTATKSVPCLFLLSSHQPMETTYLFTVSFIIQYVAFLDWLLPLSNIYLRFFHIFLTARQITCFLVLSGCTTAHISIYLLRTAWLPPSFGNYE